MNQNSNPFIRQGNFFIRQDFVDTNRDKVVASDPTAYGDLFTIIKIFENHDIKYFLSHGTCLGAVRNNALIEWDTDIDIAIINESSIKLNNCIQELVEKNDFIITKYNKSKNLYCICRHGIIIDIVNYRPFIPGLLIGLNTLEYLLPVFLVNKLATGHAKSIKVKIPLYSNMYLSMLYGQNWQKPSKKNNRFYWRYFRNILLFKRILLLAFLKGRYL